MTTFRVGMATDVGQVRETQQDSVLVDEGLRLFGVADGMGGHRGGEVASRTAVDAIRADFTEPRTAALVHAVEAANAAIVRRADGDPDLRGMGTTVCALALVHEEGEDRIGIVNVGDSRCYLFKPDGDAVDQITEDHSLVETLVRQGQLSEAEAVNHPHRNILTRALGIDSHVMVDSWELLPFAGDRYLMCSDGLFNEVAESDIASVLAATPDPTAAAEELVRQANEGGGRDNISVVVVDVVDDEGRRAAADEATSRVMAEVHGNERVTETLELVPGAAAIEGSAGETEPSSDDQDLIGSAEVPVEPDESVGAAPVDEVTASGPERVVVRPGAPSGGPDPSDAAPAPVDAPRSRFTWRVAVFLVVFLGVFVAAGVAVVYFANNTYYVGLEGEQVVIYRGRPGGILWIKPEVESRTDLTLVQVPEARRAQITAGRTEPTREDAEQFVANLRSEAAENDPTLVPSTAPGSSAPSPGTPAPSTTTTTNSLGGAAGTVGPSR